MPDLREPSQRVSPRARLMWTLGALANSAFLFLLYVLAGAAWDFVPFGLWWAIGFGVLLLVHPLLMPRWRYAVHRWEVTDTAVYTQTGWWTVERRIAPMSRIQTVDYEEGALSRLFGLATVTVTTASAAGQGGFGPIQAGGPCRAGRTRNSRSARTRPWPRVEALPHVGNPPPRRP